MVLISAIICYRHWRVSQCRSFPQTCSHDLCHFRCSPELFSRALCLLATLEWVASRSDPFQTPRPDLASSLLHFLVLPSLPQNSDASQRSFLRKARRAESDGSHQTTIQIAYHGFRVKCTLSALPKIRSTRMMWMFAEKPSSEDFSALADHLPLAEPNEIHPALWPRREMIAQRLRAAADASRLRSRWWRGRHRRCVAW